MMKPIVLFFVCFALSLCNASFNVFGVHRDDPHDHGNNIGKDDDGDKLIAKSFGKELAESKPAAMNAKNCACNTLLLSSLGFMKKHYPQVMGHYTRYGVFNNKPSYRGPNYNWLYFLPTGWIVGRHIGDPTGLITNTNKSRSYCAYEIPDVWLAIYNRTWYQDTSLVLRCDEPPYV